MFLGGGLLLSSGAGARTDCFLADSAAAPTSDDLIGRLRELSLAVDTLWKDALNKPGEGQVLEIWEASQGLHRAMVALDSFLADARPSQRAR
jgi:hypothetical protein